LNIANVLNDQGKNEEAMEKYQQVMPIYEKEYGSDSVNMAQLLSNIANSLFSQGEYEDAMEKYNLSLAIYEKVFGANYDGTIATRNNIERLKSIMQT
jgi:tetratricopeptide (TPR) repeat protein